MISISKLSKSNISEVVSLHYDSFKGFFLTSLGKPFLALFYNAILLHEDGICIGVFDNEKLIGFAIGTTNNSGFYTTILKKNYLKMIWMAFPNLIFKPLNIKRLISSLVTSHKSNYKNIPTLLSICVSSRQESKGIGRKLLEAFENELSNSGFKELILTTDFDNNEYVNEFYSRNNYSCVQSFFQGNRKMNLYYKKLKI
jgi:ribosomal protein S18 acetylase RimI-like enzyme